MSRTTSHTHDTIIDDQPTEIFCSRCEEELRGTLSDAASDRSPCCGAPVGERAYTPPTPRPHADVPTPDDFFGTDDEDVLMQQMWERLDEAAEQRTEEPVRQGPLGQGMLRRR